MKMKAFLFAAAMLLLSLPLHAQIVNNDEIKNQAAMRVAQMNDYISFMATKKKKLELRNYYRTKALNLFVGAGDEYEENGVTKQGVTMEVTSVNRKSKSHQLMRDYFSRLIKLGYNDVSITSTDVSHIKVSSLQKVGEHRYVCTCQFDQAFVGMRDGRPVYKDITTKRVKCYIIEEITETGPAYIVELGDVQADATRRG